jgi:hypothetical protein
MLGPRRILKDPALLGLVTRVGAGVAGPGHSHNRLGGHPHRHRGVGSGARAHSPPGVAVVISEGAQRDMLGDRLPGCICPLRGDLLDVERGQSS